MKIAVRAPRTPRDPGPVQPPLELDASGCALAVMNAPTTDAAWIALTERLPPGGAMLAARLTATMSRQQDATHAVAKGLAAIGERRRAGEVVPASWVDRLADLVAEELEALFRLDDAAHAAAHVPAWVEVPADQRPIPATEASWARVSRLIARELQSIKGLTDDDAAWDALGSIDPHKELGEGDVAAHEAAAKEAVRDVIRRVYGGETT